MGKEKRDQMKWKIGREVKWEREIGRENGEEMGKGRR